MQNSGRAKGFGTYVLYVFANVHLSSHLVGLIDISVIFFLCQVSQTSLFQFCCRFAPFLILSLVPKTHFSSDLYNLLLESLIAVAPKDLFRQSLVAELTNDMGLHGLSLVPGL